MTSPMLKSSKIKPTEMTRAFSISDWPALQMVKQMSRASPLQWWSPVKMWLHRTAEWEDSSGWLEQWPHAASLHLSVTTSHDHHPFNSVPPRMTLLNRDVFTWQLQASLSHLRAVPMRHSENGVVDSGQFGHAVHLLCRGIDVTILEIVEYGIVEKHGILKPQELKCHLLQPADYVKRSSGSVFLHGLKWSVITVPMVAYCWDPLKQTKQKYLTLQYTPAQCYSVSVEGCTVRHATKKWLCVKYTV